MFPCTTQFGSATDVALTTNEDTLTSFMLRTYSWRGRPVLVTEDMWMTVRRDSVPPHPMDQGLSFTLDGYLFCLNAYGLNQYVSLCVGTTEDDTLEIEGVAIREWKLVATVTHTGCAYYDDAIKQATRQGVVVELMGIVSWAAFAVNRIFGVYECRVSDHVRLMDMITGAMYSGNFGGLSVAQKQKIEQMRDLTQSYMSNNCTENTVALEIILEYASDVIDVIRRTIVNYDQQDIMVRNFVCLVGLMLCGGIDNTILSDHPLLMCSFERAARTRHGAHMLHLMFEGYGQMQFQSLYARLSREDFDFDLLPAQPRLLSEEYNLSAPQYAAEQIGVDYDQGETVAFEDVAGRVAHIIRCDAEEQDVDMLSSRPEQQYFLPYIPPGAVLTAGALRRRGDGQNELADQIMRAMRRAGGMDALRGATDGQVAAFAQDMLRRAAAEDRARNDPGVVGYLDTAIASDGEKYAPLFVVDVLRQIRPVVITYAPLCEALLGQFATTIAACHMLANPHNMFSTADACRIAYGCSYTALIDGVAAFAKDFRAYLDWVEGGRVGQRALACSQAAMETNTLAYLMVRQRTRSGYLTLIDEDMTHRARCIFRNAVMAPPGGASWQLDTGALEGHFRDYMKAPAILSVFDLGLGDHGRTADAPTTGDVIQAA